MLKLLVAYIREGEALGANLASEKKGIMKSLMNEKTYIENQTDDSYRDMHKLLRSYVKENRRHGRAIANTLKELYREYAAHYQIAIETGDKELRKQIALKLAFAPERIIEKIKLAYTNLENSFNLRPYANVELLEGIRQTIAGLFALDDALVKEALNDD